MYKVDCVILAAGKATRMNMNLNKHFLIINDKPIIWYTISKFLKHDYVSRIILVVSDDDKFLFESEILKKYFQGENISLVLGGKERQDSLFNALRFIESEYVLVHDGARPFVSFECITQGIEKA